LRGRAIVVDFHLPCGTPLQFQSVFVGQTAVEFQNKGFTAVDASETIPLASMTLAGDALVQLILQRPPVGTANVYNGRMTTFSGGGNLCDRDPNVSPFNYEYSASSGNYASANRSDQTKPGANGKPYPLWNWCIAFEMTAIPN
jgi:hypothetical protein